MSEKRPAKPKDIRYPRSPVVRKMLSKALQYFYFYFYKNGYYHAVQVEYVWKDLIRTKTNNIMIALCGNHGVGNHVQYKTVGSMDSICPHCRATMGAILSVASDQEGRSNE